MNEPFTLYLLLSGMIYNKHSSGFKYSHCLFDKSNYILMCTIMMNRLTSNYNWNRSIFWGELLSYSICNRYPIIFLLLINFLGRLCYHSLVKINANRIIKFLWYWEQVVTSAAANIQKNSFFVALLLFFEMLLDYR